MSQRKVGFMGGKFLPFHLGHLYAIIEAHNIVDKLYVVLSSSDNRDSELCKRDGIRYIDSLTRLSWIGEAVNDLENVEILHITDDEWDDNYDWENGARMITNAIPEKLTHVFSSEPEYNALFKKFYPFAEHVVIDDRRNTVLISATVLRKNLYKHWHMLPPYVASHYVKKVAIVGTESVGKSTLTKKLAKFYNTNYVSEVGIDYCKRYSNKLTVDMFPDIAMKHHLRQKKMAETSNKFLFVDTDAVITSYYLEMYHGLKSNIVDSIIGEQFFDLYLYLEIDVPWVADGFRFAGEDEERYDNNLDLKQMYFDHGFKFKLIHGNYRDRFVRSRTEIDKLIG